MKMITTRDILGFVAFSLIMVITLWFMYVFIKGCIEDILFKRRWKKRRKEFLLKTKTKFEETYPILKLEEEEEEKAITTTTPAAAATTTVVVAAEVHHHLNDNFPLKIFPAATSSSSPL